MPLTPFCSVAFVLFFSMFLYWIFVILGARRLHFSSFLCVLLGALGLWKNTEKCVPASNFRGSAPSRRSLFAGLDCGCVLMLSFCSFLWFWAIWRLPFWALLVPIVVKKRVLKNRCEKCRKGERKRTRSQVCGSFKTNKTSQQQDIGSNTPWRA